MSDDIQEPVAEIEPAPSQPASPGQILAAARMEKGLSVVDVARSLRLSNRQIEAIEADDYERLPGITFIRGFIRNYAKLLQIDPEPLLTVSQQTAAPAAQTQAISVPPGQGEFSSSRNQRTFSAGNESAKKVAKLLPVLLVIVALVGWAAYELLVNGSTSTVVVKPAADGSAVPLALPPVTTAQQPESATTVVEPVPASSEQSNPATRETPVAAKDTPQTTNKEVKPAVNTAAAPASSPVAATSGKLRLVFTGESWVEIKDKAGRTIYKQTGNAGNEQVIDGTPPFALTVGRAANVKLYYNENPVALAPTPTSGDVARLTLN